MNIPQELIEFLNLNPLNQIRYSLHCLNAWTSAPRYYLLIKLVNFLSRIGFEKASFYVLVYSGLVQRMLETGLLTKSHLDSYFIQYEYSSSMLGYGERFSSPWRHLFTRFTMFFRVN